MTRKKRRTAGRLLAIFLCLAVILGVAGYFSYQTLRKTMYPLKCTQTVETYAAQYDLPLPFVYAVIHTESGFDPQAHSHADAYGLMQITPETFDWLQTKTDDDLPTDALWQEDVNIRYGCLFLRMLLDEFENEETALAAYNAGRGQVNIWLKNPDVSTDGKTLDRIPISETAHYVQKVMKAKAVYESLYFS